MAVALPDLSAAAFAEGLAACTPEPLPPATIAALHAHYSELRRWSASLALIGPGTAEQVVRRHYGESLAALPWLGGDGGRLVDLGSGAGFPGLVLAAARPQWRVTLVEPRQRKWAFLEAAARRAALSCHCLDARVAPRLPAGLPDAFEALTVRALRLSPATLTALADRLVTSGRMFFWTGEEAPALPVGWRWAVELPLPGARSRRLTVAERERA